MQRLGKRLSHLRGERSRREIAEAIGATVETIRDLEYRGHHRRLAELLPKLANLYEVDLANLLGIKSDPAHEQMLKDAKAIRSLAGQIIQGLSQ